MAMAIASEEEEYETGGRSSLRERLQRESKRPPWTSDGSPLIVKAGIYIESLGKFQSTEMVVEDPVNVDFMYLSKLSNSLSNKYHIEFILMTEYFREII